MNAELFSATVLLILVIDPFGNVPLVVSALKSVPPERHLRVVLRECAAAYVILVGFMLGGRTFLQWLRLSEESPLFTYAEAPRNAAEESIKKARGE